MIKPFLITLSFAIPLAFVFIFFPEIDLKTSSLFYREDSGFFLNRNPINQAIHDSSRIIVYGIVTFFVAILVMIYVRKANPFGLYPRHILFLAACLAIGPGLVVNTVFKDNWGRARPLQTVEFGGTAKFTPAFEKTNQCKRNCSFVSGDPSVGFFFLSFAFLYPHLARRWTLFALTLGTILGLNRILQGSHFLSDVIFSFVFVYTTIFLLSRIKRLS